MKLISSLIAALSLCACQAPDAPAKQDTAGGKEALASVMSMPVAGFSSHIESGEYRLVDVRTPEEFAEGHIEGAVNVPLDQFEPADFDGQELLLYCRSGRRSHEAATALAQYRKGNAIHLQGGIIAWQEAGQPVVTE